MRLFHIDLLKGLAIFFMIMGHFLSWTFEGGIPPDNEAIRIVRDFIYAFHMPLFMFMSGYVIDLNNTKLNQVKSILQIARKRAISLLVPSVTYFVMIYFNSGGMELPWFLISLFCIITLFCIIQLAIVQFKLSKLLSFMLYVIGYLFLLAINRFTQNSFINILFHMTETQIMYPYFVLGYLFKSNSFYRYFKVYPIYTMSLICFIILFNIYYFYENTPAVHAMIRYCLAVCGIFVIYHLARDINQNRIIYKWFSYLGTISIQIYLLSFWFIPIFPSIGELICESIEYDPFIIRTTIFIQIIASIVVSLYCVTMCILVAKIIERSWLLNFLLFGKK